MSTVPIVAIVNPAAGRRKPTGIPAGVQILETKAPGHATDLTRDSIRRGAETIIAAGGDGTVNEVVNGFFENEEPIGKDVTLTVIPQGTGSDFCRVVQQLQRGDKRMVDLMKVRFTASDGSPRLRYGINVTSFGMGAVVTAKVNRSSKPFGGMIAFLAATLQTTINFKGNTVKLRLDDARTVEAEISNVAVGNGQYQGAGMWICPGAIIDDGLLDVTLIEYLSVWELLRNLPVLYNGGIYSHPKVQSYRVKRLTAESREPAFVEIDGEPAGRLPLEISVLPQAIRVLMP